MLGEKEFLLSVQPEINLICFQEECICKIICHEDTVAFCHPSL